MKFIRYLQKRRRAMFAMAALTLFANPFTAHASNITVKDGATLTPTNNVYNIEVQKKLSNSVGVNKFSDFTLDKGQIANMQFDNLTTLANLVDKKININGTVNALRDGKIGGNLYFLSPEGIAVGASGVINAGSFTGMAVDKDYFEELGKMTDATKFTNAISPENMIYNNDPKKGIDIQGIINAPGGINLYATKIDIGSGAILRTDVEGVDFSKVVNIENVDSGITGGLDAEYKDGDIVLKAYAGQVLDASALTTKEEVESATSKWEKITDLEATVNVDGTIRSANDVSINAESVVVFKENKNFNAVTQTSVIGGLLKKANLDASVNYARKSSKATVNIGKTADVYSAGNMDISANSTLDVGIETVTPAKGKANKWIPAAVVGVVVANNEATVNIDGKLESKGTMSINANATTTLNVDAKTKTSFETKEEAEQNKGDDDKKDDSNTDNNSDSNDSSSSDSSSNDSSSNDSSSNDSSNNDSSNNDNSSNDSSNNDSSNNDSSNNDDSSQQEKTADDTEDRFYIAVGVISGTTKAEVNINSGDEIKVGGADGKDESGNEIKAFEANAIGENTLSITTNASSKDKSTINTSVGVMSYTSNAILNVDRAITAEDGSINLNANNSTTNESEISNVLGSEVAPFENPFFIDPENTSSSSGDSSSGDSSGGDSSGDDSSGSDIDPAEQAKTIGKQLLNTEEAKAFIEEAKSKGKELLEELKTKLKGLLPSKSEDEPKDEDAAPLPDKVGGKTFAKVLDGEYLKAGVAVNVYSQSNTATVNIKNNANITAKNDVEVNAINEITRQNLSVESDVNNLKDTQKTASMVGLGVLVSDIDNNADIIVDGSLTANEGDITLTSDSGMKYNQFNALVDDLKEQINTIKEDLSSDEETDQETKNEVDEKLDGYNEQLDKNKVPEDTSNTENTNNQDTNSTEQNADSKDDASEFMSNLSKLGETISNITKDSESDESKNAADKIKNEKLKQDIADLASNLTAFLHPSSYANYYVRSAFSDSKEADDADASKIDAAGSISIDTMISNSRILMGKDSNVKAENGTVEVDSNAKGGVVAITGMGGEFLTSSEAAKNGAGISVMLGKFSNNAVVAVGKSEINAGDIKLKTKDDSKHVNIIYGNGKADSTTVTGMVSYINSPTNSIISIDDSAKLNADNDINFEATGEDYITSVNGAITLGNGNGKSFGAALNILSNDKNVAVNIGDNGYLNETFADNISAFSDKTKTLTEAIKTESVKTDFDADKIISDKTELKILTLNKRTQEILGKDYFNSLGASAVNSDGLINAKNITVKSKNSGTINSIAVEGTENSESHGFADGFNDKVYKGETALNYADDAFKWLANKLGEVFGDKDKKKELDKSGEKKPGEAGKEAGVEAGNEVSGDNDSNGAASNLEVDDSDDSDNSVENQLNIASAGSAAININSGATGSFISNTNLKADNVNVSADDDTFKGAWAGAGAFNFFGDSEAAKNTNVSIGGSVAYSDNSKSVNSIIKDTTIDSSDIKNTATRDDSDVAAGMGLSVSKSDEDAEGSNTSVAVSTSINFVDGDTHALLINNTVSGGSLENKAAIDSLQVSGGLDIAATSSGEKGFSIGGSAAASKIINDLQSGVKGGSYENITKADITADKKSNQIDVAVGGGISTGAEEKGFAFGGGVAVSDINNNSRAFLNDTTKFDSSGVINVDALDSKNENNRSAYLSSRKININPTSYLNSADKDKVNPDGGGSIVNVAFGGGASTDESGSSGLGISYAGIANLVNVDISNNENISAQNLNANTTNKSNIVNVTAGVAGSTGSFSGAGSASVTDIKNDGTINIANSNVTANNFLSGAQSKAHIVNVAGQTALADEFAGGLTFAYNAMKNTTGINVSGGNWNVNNFGADANNNNYALAVGAGVAFSKESSALNGSVGLNMGTNSTKAIVDGSTITGVDVLNATATDRTSKTTVAGGLTINKDGAVAAGGAVAYANIGKENNKEIINAKITNSTVSAKTINVKALDNATMTTVGAGAGGSISDGKLTFQGAAAVSALNKENIAEISNTTISDGADVNIISTSGGNSSGGLNLNDKNINVNNKINTIAAVLDANFSDESWFSGALATSVNKFNQSTEANLKNDSRPEIISQAGNVNIYSNSEDDILSVAAGGSGGKATASTAGSTAYNYIDNSAKTLVENANVNAAKNFGVVAQSDDKLANYAGAVNVNTDGYATIGVSVAYNEIKGNTDANIKNSNLNVTGSDSNLIAISNPKDNLIDGYVTKNNWTSGRLMSGRKTENKSGLVVNSSATHSISSDLATIGVRATSDSPGVGVSGTVNINKISGATNAKVENSDVTATNKDTFVNASDYTNNGSFIGNASASGTVAIGMLWNENKVDRATNALVDGGTFNVKNLDVKADGEQGISNLNIAVSAGFTASKSQVFAAASGDNVVRNQMEGTTTAKLENATVNHSGAVGVNAYHKDIIYATNIAAGVSVDTNSAGATFDMGYGLMRENSTVKAEINNSTLTSASGAVNVNAENNSQLAGAFGTAGIAVHAGAPGAAAAVALGINNNYVTNTVHAGIKDSTLDVGAVDVNALNSSKIKADGGVAAVALNISKAFIAAMGAAVAVTNGTFDNVVTADVDNSTINAAGDVNVQARDDHKSEKTVVSAALSTGLAVSVNRMSTSVNNGLANLKEDQLGNTLSAGDLVMNTDNASKENSDSDIAKLIGEYGSEKRFLDENTITTLIGGIHANSTAAKENISSTLKERYTATVNYNNSLKKGVFANVQNNSTINAGENKISIGSTENNDLAVTSGSGSGGIIGVGVGSTSIKANRANTANVIGSTLNAKNIDITTTNGQTGSDGINSRMYNATLTGIGASVGYNNVETNGTGEILISNSKITATENINAKATDNSKSRSYILDAGLKGVGYTGVFAYNTNTSQTGIEVSNESALTANAIDFDAQNYSHRSTDTLAISASGVNVPTSTSEAKDTSTNFINVKDAGNTFTADTLNFNALNSGQTYAHINGQAYLGLNAIIAKGRAFSNINSNISIDDANTFKAGTANITSQIGEENKYTAETTGFAINGSAIGINVDNMYAQTGSTAKVNVGNEYFNDDTTLNINALNKASRNSFMRNNAYSLVANANDISAYTIANDAAKITVGNNSTLENANKLGVLNINANTESKSYVAAKGTGGSIGGDFGSAAHADNDAYNTSEATLNGTWNIANDLTLNANQHDSAYISGYSARGAILTGGKSSLDNVIAGKSTATISDGATINAKIVNVNSKNYIMTDKYSDEYDYTLFGRMGGVVDDVDYQRSTATTNKSANINIGNNATITTTGTQTYDAASDYNLKNNVYAEGGSLLASLRWVKSHNYITADEKISVGTGATLKNEGGTYADGGIILATHDNLELNPTAKGYSQAGTGGYVRAETITDLTRNQNIDIDGTIKSAKDLNLYAGADTDGKGSRVNSYAQAISQVQTLISDGSADIIRRGSTKSNVNVNSGAYGQATHDVNVISNAGNERYEEFAFYGSTWSDDTQNKVATADNGNLTTANYTHSNNVKVDGELKAANTPNATINISGIAIPDKFVLTYSNAKNLSYSVKSGDITITKKSTDFTGKSSEEIFAQQIYNGISTATTDYANDYLLKRYDEVEKLLGDYSGDVSAYTALQQEKAALENEMVKLGMGSFSTSTGKFIMGATSSIEIKTLVLPDVEVSGGSINVVTDNFNGSGKLNASGVPKIDIENKSTAYLITNRLTIGDKGGTITYNGTNVDNNAAINNLNISKSGATFTDMKVANSTEIPTITVSNTYSGQNSIPMKPNPNAEGYDTLPEKAKTETQTYTPINFIEATKDITNPVGKVVINNNQGSIRILSGANVNAQDIAMTAKESISQGYTDGIVNIADTPEYSYADEAKKLRESTGWDAKMPESDQIIERSSTWQYSGGTGRIAGDAIYIAARDVNINGLIQSGYKGFKASVTQADIDNATETVFFNGSLMYKVNEGGTKVGSDGYYIYEPQIYYDKSNNKLYVEDINAIGGKVYLSGRILSTGNGKIVVSDGASNVDIINNSSIDMNVGNVRSLGGDGFIQIVDTAQDKLTEYSSGRTRTINNYSAWLADNSKGTVTTGAGLTIGQLVTYNPKSNLTYRWAEGSKSSKTYNYYKDEERSWWGLEDDPTYTGRYEDMSVTDVQTSGPVDDKDPLGTGVFIDENADQKIGGQKSPLRMYAQNQSSIFYGVTRPAYMTKSGFAGFYHHWHHYWFKEVGSKQTYVYSVKADYPISVGLIGDNNPTINLTNASTTGGDLYLTGNIRNDVGSDLNITASGGKIEQAGGTKISTNNVKLTARDGINNIDITNHRTDDLKLSAQTTNGDIDVNVTGGIFENKNLAGNVVVDALNSKDANVTLKAKGDIKQTLEETTVNARNIKLESTNGSINLQIESSGQGGADFSAISAAANGDIKLVKNDSSDFLVGSIVSTIGDVDLTAKGKFVDALDKVRDNADTQESELVKSWIDMGLIAGTDDYKGAYLNRLEHDRDNYKSDVTEQFAEYKTLLESYQSKVAEYNELEDKTGTTAPAMNERLELLDKKFSKYATADAYLAADSDYQTLVSTAANPQYQWTQDELLTGIRSAIVNKQEGTASDVTHLKDANITARNVTLTGTGVGSNSKEVTTIKMSELKIKDNETADEKAERLEKVSRLANVEAADVKVNLALDSNGNPITQTVAQVNYNYDVDNGYYIDTAGNYIRYRNDADGNLLKYTYTKDADNNFTQVGNAVAMAKDASGNYDFSDVIKDTTTIENKAIESFEISGTIPLGINATGNITVKTTGNDGTYIVGRNKGVKIDETTNPNKDVYNPMNINTVETAKADGNYGDVRIISEVGIFNANSDTSAANVIGKDLVLVGGNGAIGTESKPLTVQLTGDLLDARSNEDVNLQKVGRDNFRVSAVYSPKAIRISTDGRGIIEHSSRFDDIAAAYLNTPGAITLTGSAGTANNPILIRPTATTILNLRPVSQSIVPDFYIKGMNSGTVNLNDISGNLDISSDGSIGQTQNSTNSLNSLKFAAVGDVIFNGNNNKFSTVNVGEVGGTFELKNNSDSLTLNFSEDLTGDVKINQTGDIHLAGTFSGNVLSLTSTRGNVISTGGLKAAKEINLNLANFTHEGEIHTDKLTIATNRGVTINNTENTFNELEISSRNGKAINGSINVAIKSDKFAPTIKNDVTGNVTLENTKSGGTLSFGDGESINIGGTFTAKTNVGDFDYGSTLLAGKDISITAQNIYRREGTTGYFFTPSTILFNAQNSVGTAENPIMIANSANKTAGMDIYGEMHIKGVNNGILTLGNVITDKDVSISSEGSIAQADDQTKVISVPKITVEAVKDITLDNAKNDIETITINGGNNVKVNSLSTKGLTVEGNLQATGDVDITSDKSLTLNGDIESAKNVSLTAGTNLTSNKSSAIKSANDITLKADDVKLNGKIETSYKEMTSDKIEDVEKFIEEMPAIKVTTNKGLDMRNAANSFEGVIVNSDGKQINGSILVTGNSDGFLTVIDEEVMNNITLKNTKSEGVILLLDKGTLKSTKGSITLDMDGDFGAGANIWANKDINITSRKGSITVAKLSSLNESLKSDSESTDTLKAKNINLKATKTIEIEGQITAGKNITANSAGINIIGNAGSVEAGENIKLTVDEGNIGIEGSVTSNQGDMDISINKGNLDIAGNLRANKGAIDIEITEGNIQIGKDTPNAQTVVANGDINIITDKGIINISGKTKSTTGSVNIKTDKNTYSTSASTSYSDDDESILFDATADVEEIGDITVDAEIEANNSVLIATDEGNIDVTKRITVNNGNIIITTLDGNITIKDNGSEDMLSAQNDLDILTTSGAVVISGKISTQDGNITITSNQDSYTANQKGITVESTGAINPGKNVELNTINGDIEFKKISAQNADIGTINGNVTGNTIDTKDTIRIELANGDLYLNLAKSKGVVILTGDSSNSTVNTIRANSVDVNDAVKVGRIISYQNASSGGSSSGSSSGGSSYISGYNNSFSNGYSNFANNSSGSSYAILGTTYTNNGLTYWQNAQNATSTAAPDYSFSEFESSNDMSHRQTRNYFEVKFVPSWIEKEFMSIDFDYSLDNFGIKNANEDELTID